MWFKWWKWQKLIHGCFFLHEKFLLIFYSAQAERWKDIKRFNFYTLYTLIANKRVYSITAIETRWISEANVLKNFFFFFFLLTTKKSSETIFLVFFFFLHKCQRNATRLGLGPLSSLPCVRYFDTITLVFSDTFYNSIHTMTHGND